MWERVKLSEVCELVQYGYTASATDENTGTKFLRITDIVPEFINWDEVPFCEIETKEASKYKVFANDIVIARTGATVGYAKRLKNDFPNAVFASYLIRIRPNDAVDAAYIGYIVESKVYKDYIICIANGAAQPNANAQDLVSFEFPLPLLPLQRRIAAVLSRYDALLENYQQQVAALEGLAQEVYREWFVRGRCPGVEAKPEGELPAGWRIATLDEVAYDARRIVKIDDIDPDAAYVGLEHLSVKSISITATGTPDDISSDKLAFEENDILFGKIRAYLHKVCLAHFAGVCSTDAIVIRPRIENALSFVLFTVFSEHFIEYADLISNGTKMPRSEWSVLKTYQIILPNNRALAAFEEVARPMLDKIANLQKQSNYLRATRDALLPRLLSGQLTVHAAEATLAA